MSMIGVSVASSKSLQLEATQEAYNRAVIKLNEPPRDCRRLNILREYDNENTKLHS